MNDLAETLGLEGTQFPVNRYAAGVVNGCESRVADIVGQSSLSDTLEAGSWLPAIWCSIAKQRLVETLRRQYLQFLGFAHL